MLRMKRSCSGIDIVGSLSPQKQCQDRVRILGGGGTARH